MPSTKKTLRDTYDRIAPHFDSTRKSPWPKVMGFIGSLPEKSVILDLAAGTGRHARYAKSQGHTAIASDFSTGQLMELRKKDPSIPLVIHDLEHIPFRENSFDAVTYIAAIHHLDNEPARIRSLEESRRILKTGGKILTTAWSVDQPRFKGRAGGNGDIHYTWDKKYPRFYHLFKEGELEKIHKNAGLEKVSAFREGDNYYFLALKAEKKNGPSST